MNNHIKKNQDIIALLDFDGELHSFMDTVVSAGEDLPPMWYGYRREENKLQGCISVTYFVCERTHEGLLHIEGESNSSVMRGVISLMRDVLEGECAAEVNPEEITWHQATGLMTHLTPQRQGAVLQILNKIEKCCRME